MIDPKIASCSKEWLKLLKRNIGLVNRWHSSKCIVKGELNDLNLVSSMWEDYARLLKSLFEIGNPCSRCRGKCCCFRSTGYHEVQDLVRISLKYDLQELVNYASPKNVEECLYYKPAEGCVLPLEMRPTTCILYFCDEHRKALDTHQWITMIAARDKLRYLDERIMNLMNGLEIDTD
jgi:hypothetical protein